MKTKIVIDSTSTIPLEFAQKNNMSIMEISITYKGDHKKELTEVDYEDFMNTLEDLEEVPTTSFASPKDALDLFQEAIDEGYERLLYPYMTIKISNQVSSAHLAVKKVKNKLDVVFYDTELAGPSQAPFALYSIKMLEEGKKIEEIIEFFNRVKLNIHTVGISEDFSTLFRTGKVKKSVPMSLLTSTLKLKPLCEIPINQGVVGYGGGVGFNGGVSKIIKRFQEISNENLIYDVIITHSDALEKGQILEKEIRKIRTINNVLYWNIPPAILNTVGKGAAMATLYPNFEEF